MSDEITRDAGATKSGHTYILAYPSLKLLKIGQSVYYAERLDQVQNMSPVATEVVCALVGLHHERQLHQRFSHLRRYREFFDDTDEIRNYVLNHPDMISHREARDMQLHAEEVWAQEAARSMRRMGYSSRHFLARCLRT